MFDLDIIDGDLYIAIIDEYNKDNSVIVQLENGTEFEFIDGEIASIIFPDFERKLNRGDLDAEDFELVSININDDGLLMATVAFEGQHINIKVDCSELKKQNI